MAGWLQLTGVLINLKGEDIPAGLIGRNQELACGINAKIAGRLALGGLMLNGFKHSGILIDLEYSNRIVTAI